MLGNLFIYIIMALYAVIGGGSTILIVGYLFIVLTKKIINKIKNGASLYA